MGAWMLELPREIPAAAAKSLMDEVWAGTAAADDRPTAARVIHA